VAGTSPNPQRESRDGGIRAIGVPAWKVQFRKAMSRSGGRRCALGALFIACAAGCTASSSPDDAAAFLGSASGYRRDLLVSALWRPDLPYSQLLLENYGLGDRGWDLLPLLAETSAPFTAADGDALQNGHPLPFDDRGGEEAPIPIDEAGWRDLGRRTFFELPMRSDDYIEWIAARPDLWARVGLEVRPDGSVRGLVRFKDESNRISVAITCALCHGQGDVVGSGSRSIDLGLARALFAEAQGAPEPRFLNWGKGRIDVTDDGIDAPTAIPDLFGAAYERYLNASGVIERAPESKATLALRFETQYIEGHNLERRPSRARVWALAELVLQLRAPTSTAAVGRDVFLRRCGSCHDPNDGYSGGLVRADLLTSDPTVAHTKERGTGFYKVPSLVRISERAPYLHDASQPTLEALIASGHPFGHAPPADEVSALLEFLRRI
jgi:hypothetical protein